MKARWWLAAVLSLAPMSARADDTPAPAPVTASDERDKRYEEKFRSIEQRFGAQEKSVETALIASDKRYEQRFAAQEKAVDSALSAAKEAVAAALQAAKEAVTKAEVASEKRFENMNEFRGQLKDQAATFVSRTEFDSVKTQLASLTARMDNLQGAKEGKSDSWAFFVAALGALVLISGLYIGIQRRKTQEPRGSVES